MTETLADIEALAISCRSDQAKEYVAEALKCYRASANRAAIVTTWIAVVFDLIDKIRELAMTEDGAARELAAQHERYIGQIEDGNPQGIEGALAFERDILDVCASRLQFFDSQQLLDLQRLREDRHRCAHPSFQKVGMPYIPSAEQARLHLRNAIVHVLSQAPVQGRAAVVELTAIVSSAYFPKDTGKATQQLQSSSLASATDALVRGFVDAMVFGYLTEGGDLYAKEQTIAAINAVLEMYPAIVEGRLAKQLNKAALTAPDELLYYVVCLVVGVSQGWEVLEAAGRDKIHAFVDEGPAQEFLALLASIEPVTDLRESMEARVNQLEFSDLVIAVDLLGIGGIAKHRAMQFLSEAGSWDRANAVFTQSIFPLYDELSREDIERIIRMPKETGADLLGAHAFSLFIDKVRESDIFEDEELNQLIRENRGSYLLPQEEQEQTND